MQIVRLGLKESVGLVCPLNRGLISPGISEFRSLLKCLFNERSEVMSRGNVSWASSSVPGETPGETARKVGCHCVLGTLKCFWFFSSAGAWVLAHQ